MNFHYPHRHLYLLQNRWFHTHIKSQLFLCACLCAKLQRGSPGSPADSPRLGHLQGPLRPWTNPPSCRSLRRHGGGAVYPRFDQLGMGVNRMMRPMRGISGEFCEWDEFCGDPADPTRKSSSLWHVTQLCAYGDTIDSPMFREPFHNRNSCGLDNCKPTICVIAPWISHDEKHTDFYTTEFPTDVP